MASRCGSDCRVVLVLPLVPDFSGEPLPVTSGTHPRRKRANSSVNWAISLRAPPYVYGLSLFFLGSAFLLGSWIGVLLGLLFEGILARRAVREERELRMGLKGYDAYMAQVKYRLIPHVW